MFDNSSSSNEPSLPHLSPLISSDSFNSSFPLFYLCLNSVMGYIATTVFTCINALLHLPLSAFILHLGLQQRQRQGTAVMNSTDLITFQMVVMELISCLGSVLYCVGVYVSIQLMSMIGVYIFGTSLIGRPLFHCLTCMERYIAVLHPITYQSLRTAGGVRLRNVLIGCVWLLCLGWLALIVHRSPYYPIYSFFSIFAILLLLVSFFSLSVLRTLHRRGPRDREKGNQLKRRVFRTMGAIWGVLLVKFAMLLISCLIYIMVKTKEVCVLLTAVYWVTLPSTMVLPLLFLHRAGKLPWCRNNVGP